MTRTEKEELVLLLDRAVVEVAAYAPSSVVATLTKAHSAVLKHVRVTP